MNGSWIWFALAALALIGEVASGTFYLMTVAFGGALAGVAAWLGVGLPWQIAVCAAGVLLALLILRKTKVLRKYRGAPESNADLNIDIGQTVKVESWNEDGTARVWYRGAHWQAELAPGAEPAPGTYVISSLHGNSLVLSPA